MRTCYILIPIAVALVTIGQRPVWSEDLVVKELDKVVSDLTTEKVVLKYHYQPDEKLRYRVEHVSTVETRMKGVFQTSRSRSESIKTWRINSVDPTTKVMQFEHQIDSVDMWNEVTGKKPVRFNSKTDEKPPEQYANIADAIGTSLSQIVMDEHGRIIERKDFVPQIDMGMGGISIPLPDHPVAVGNQWSSATDLRVRDQQNRLLVIKTRQVYELKGYSAGVATISVKTQVLTPLRDPAVRSQIVQRLSNGELKFDVDAGRILRRELDWNETVIGFSGQDSNMKYLARLIEELVTDKQDSNLAASTPMASMPREKQR